MTIRLLCFVLPLLVCLHNPPATAETTKRVFMGTLVDITCATDPKRIFTKLRSEHGRKCLLMPVCAESGYALLTERDEVLRLDATGNEIARKLIQKNSRRRTWQVSVDGVQEEDRLTVQRMRLIR